MAKAQKKKKRSRLTSVLWLGGVVDVNMAERVNDHIIKCQAAGVDTLIVRICSGGGGVVAGLAIFDTLLLAPFNLITEVWGECCSTATLLLQAGDVRRISPNSRIMVHNMTASPPGQLSDDDLIRTSGELKYMSTLYQRLISERTGVSVAKLQTMMAEETYFTATEAVKAGFVDNIMRR